MSRFILPLIWLILLFGATAANCEAQSNQSFAGRVVDQNGAGVAGATVVLRRQDVRFVREATTDRDGNFKFADLTAGEYEIRGSAKNFGSTERRITDFEKAVELVLQPAQVAAEVSVTAGLLAGTPESLSEIPGAIERVDRQTLENSRVYNFSEALRKVSGVNVRDEEGFGLRPNIGIRGTNPTRSSKVLLLEDGIPLGYAPYGDNASYYHPPIERYESIEVLKGSGQIAYGPQTLAGVINYATPNPPADRQTSLKIEGGNNRFFDGSVGYGDTFGRLGLITNFTHKRGAGARENTFSKLYDSATKAVLQISDRQVLTGKFTFYREDSNVTYSGLTEAEFVQNQRGNRFRNDFFRGNRYGLALQHAAVISSKVNLVTIFYSNYFSRDWWRQSSNSNERPNRVGSDPDCRGLIDLNTTCGNQGRLRDYVTTGFEPRLNANFDLGLVRNELNVGFRIHFEKQNRRQENGDLPDSRVGTVVERNIRKNLAYSGFVQHRFVFGDFAITPGVRVERIEFQRENRLTTATFAGSIGRTSLTETIPGIGVAYSGIKNITVFAGVHRGFAPPRTEDIVSNTGGVIDLDPERSWNYELGARTRPFRGAAIEAAFFRNDYSNQVVAASIAGGAGAAFTNGGKTLQQGVEFATQIDSGAILRSPHNFYLRAAYTYLPVAEFRGTRFSSIAAQSIVDPNQRRLLCPAGCSVTGNRLPYVPRNTVTSSLGYSHPRGFDAFVENVFIGGQFADDLNSVDPIRFSNGFNGQTGVIVGQTYWNATANYKIERLKTVFFVTAKNLFDRTFVVDRSRGILPSIPRLVQAGVKLNF